MAPDATDIATRCADLSADHFSSYWVASLPFNDTSNSFGIGLDDLVNARHIDTHRLFQ